MEIYYSHLYALYHRNHVNAGKYWWTKYLLPSTSHVLPFAKNKKSFKFVLLLNWIFIFLHKICCCHLHSMFCSLQRIENHSSFFTPKQDFFFFPFFFTRKLRKLELQNLPWPFFSSFLCSKELLARILWRFLSGNPANGS